jgi:hypothetical protein
MRLINKTSKKLAVAVAMVTSSMVAQAATMFEFGEDQSLNLGVALRYSYTNQEDSAGNGGHSTDFNLDSIRFMLGASLNKTVKATISTEREGDRVHLLDVFGQFEVMPEFNIWAGRLVCKRLARPRMLTGKFGV